MKSRRHPLLGLILPGLLLGLPHGSAGPRVIVLGFDGADPVLLERWMDSGDLPNLARLRQAGTYARLATSEPAESPVSWACFETGSNPGKTRIFDFLARRAGTYHPEIALVRAEMRIFEPGRVWARNATLVLPAVLGLVLGLIAWITPGRRPSRVAWMALAGIVLGFGVAGAVSSAIPAEMPVPVSQRRGESFWEILGRHGVPCTVLNAPLAFPAAPFPGGKLLSGLGTPDLRQTWGTFFCFRDDLEGDRDTETGGKWIRVRFDASQATASIPGPRHPLSTGREAVAVPLEILRDAPTGRVRLRAQGQEHDLRPGEWSPFFELSFPFHPFFQVHGIARFRLLSAADPFQLYLSPVQIHPRRPPPQAPISFPPDFARELADHVGLFETLGWAVPTNPLKDETIDEDAFLENLKFTEGNRRRMLFHQLDEPGWRCLVAVFMGPDRIQHLFWRFIDPQHPLYDPGQAKKYAGAILDVYREMDDIVGQVLESCTGTDTTLLVLSDHGFHSFRKGVNLNTWLVRNGYMTLTPGSGEVYLRLEDLFDDRGQFFKNVDWSRTRAYALGLGKISLNLAGREPQGRVAPGEEFERVREQIRQEIFGLRDPETGERVVRRCSTREELYHGPYASESADLILGFEPGYRVSWQTAVGGIPAEVIEPNRSKWSGDHCSVDPEATPGIFLSNRRYRLDRPSISDLAPTILDEFGIDSSADMDGRPFPPAP